MGKSINEKSTPLELNDESLNCYLDSDKGPFYVHLHPTEDEQDMHDMTMGLRLKNLCVKGIKEVKKISRRELKVIFSDRNLANGFLKSAMPSKLKVKAFVPRYNIIKVGIVFDIPVHYDSAQLYDCLESQLPIVDIFRCQKRKIVNGQKTKEWISASTIKVSFRGQELPDEVRFGYSMRKVKLHIPGVLQCFKCLRFGHMNKFCKQVNATCKNCGIQHVVTDDYPCPSPMKCFHCHSDKHNGTSKECPEFSRNQLIKEPMICKNLTFSEADAEFPRAQSCFILAEKRNEFPKLRKRANRDPEERVEESFPRKTNQELSKQYGDYLLLNRGKKPTNSSQSRSYSEAVKLPISATNEQVEIANKRKDVTRGSLNKQEENESHVGRNAETLIEELHHKLMDARTDPDQKAHSTAFNDLLLIEINRMILDFVHGPHRKIISYSSDNEEEGNLETDN